MHSSGCGGISKFRHDECLSHGGDVTSYPKVMRRRLSVRRQKSLLSICAGCLWLYKNNQSVRFREALRSGQRKGQEAKYTHTITRPENALLWRSFFRCHVVDSIAALSGSELSIKPCGEALVEKPSRGPRMARQLIAVTLPRAPRRPSMLLGRRQCRGRRGCYAVISTPTLQ